MDLVIYHRVMSILAEMGLSSPISLIDDFDPIFSIKNVSEHRLYEFHLEIRDDVDTTDLAADFCIALEDHNKISSIKADFYELNEYPGPVPNCSEVYLTVATI